MSTNDQLCQTNLELLPMIATAAAATSARHVRRRLPSSAATTVVVANRRSLLATAAAAAAAATATLASSSTSANAAFHAASSVVRRCSCFAPVAVTAFRSSPTTVVVAPFSSASPSVVRRGRGFGGGGGGRASFWVFQAIGGGRPRNAAPPSRQPFRTVSLAAFAAGADDAAPRKLPKSVGAVGAEGDAATPTTTVGKSRKSKRGREKRSKDLLRADRVLSDRGVGTRSVVFKLLRDRRVKMLDPRGTGRRIPVVGPSEKIRRDAELYLDGKLVPGAVPLLTAYHKPKNVLSSMEADRSGKTHLGELLPPRYKRGKVHPVGRLDYDSSGLMLFSSDGDLTQRLLHPRHGVEKEYLATVEGTVNETELRARLEEGVETTEGVHTAELLEATTTTAVASTPSREAVSEASETDDVATATVSEDDDAGAASALASTESSDVRLVVSEGKHRMVRRMLANCGHPVLELRRERYGRVTLGSLDVGEFRDLNEEEAGWAEDALLRARSKRKGKKPKKR